MGVLGACFVQFPLHTHKKVTTQSGEDMQIIDIYVFAIFDFYQNFLKQEANGPLWSPEFQRLDTDVLLYRATHICILSGQSKNTKNFQWKRKALL